VRHLATLLQASLDDADLESRKAAVSTLMALNSKDNLKDCFLRGTKERGFLDVDILTALALTLLKEDNSSRRMVEDWADAETVQKETVALLARDGGDSTSNSCRKQLISNLSHFSFWFFT
jgi:hypothetical protein